MLGVAMASPAAWGKEVWWSLRPVRVPEKGETIDHWVDAGLRARGLVVRERASRAVLARRTALALAGLPPEWRDDFGMHAAHVDALLASPHFGERWARHWMDVVRFAESKGHEYDYEIPGAWRYRDYLIHALNNDTPWPQLVREHLIGDLIEPASDRTRAATIWWMLGESTASPVDLANDEGDRIDGSVDVLGKAFLGLTTACARCHDHKFDPISHKDYHALAGIVASLPMDRAWADDTGGMAAAAEKLRAIREVNGAAPERMVLPDFPNGKILADLADPLPADWSLRGFAEAGAPLGVSHGLWTGLLSRKLPAVLRSPRFIIEHDFVYVLCRGGGATALVSVANLQVIRDPIYNGLRQEIKDDAWHWQKIHVGRWRGHSAYFEVFTGAVDLPLDTALTPQSQWAVRAVAVGPDLDLPAPPEIDERFPMIASDVREAIDAEIPRVDFYLTIAENGQGRDLPLAIRGDARKPSDVVPRGFLKALQPLTGVADVTQGSGRRELADHILSPHNPLTSRVLVNRVWHWLFGRGLVSSPDDFGAMGSLPSHPELLDLLAWRFEHEHRGSLKALLREILLSETWQRASAPESPEADATNIYLSHFPLRRVEAETIRDAMLSVSGRLDPKIGGPSVGARPRAQFFSTNTKNQKETGPVDGDGRRSLYIRTRRSFPDAFLTLFDVPAPVTSFGRRDVSNIPAQSLALLNDPLPNELARFWGERLAADARPIDEKIRDMIRSAFTREPHDGEIAHAHELLGADPTVNAWTELALAFFNLKEFIYVP